MSCKDGTTGETGVTRLGLLEAECG